MSPEERERLMQRLEAETEAARIKTVDLTSHLASVLAQIRAVRAGASLGQPPEAQDLPKF